jgi:uncharacterized protein (TIGR02145 family)
MKNLFLLLSFVLMSIFAFGQTPLGIHYQTIIRDSDGQPLTNTALTLKMTIRANTVDGEVVYTETHAVVSNTFGLVNLVIGQGTPQTGEFSAINWGTASHFLETAVDLTGSGQFQVLGVTQFLSVPYSLFSENGIRSMTTVERDSLINPTIGLQIFNSTTKCLNYYTGVHWFETCGECTPQPTEAIAGDDQFGLQQNWVVLQGNQAVVGQGYWSIIYGEGGQIVDPFNPNSIFYGQTNTLYILQWEIETECRISFDQVNLEFGSYVFACGDSLLDERDQQKYGTVPIGTQCWMSENLNIGAQINKYIQSTNNGIIEKYCYSDAEQNCDMFGALYDMDELFDYAPQHEARGICMEGWHLPSSQDWNILIAFCGGTGVAGGKLKQTGNLQQGTGLWYSPNTGATNSTGFNGLPGGHSDGDNNGYYEGKNLHAFFVNSSTGTSFIKSLWFDDSSFDDIWGWSLIRI